MKTQAFLTFNKKGISRASLTAPRLAKGELAVKVLANIPDSMLSSDHPSAGTIIPFVVEIIDPFLTLFPETLPVSDTELRPGWVHRSPAEERAIERAD